MERLKLYRYALSVALVAGMTAVSAALGDREVVFPEAAALAVGLWVVDKPVWRVRRGQLVAMMTLGAAAGVSLVRHSPFPLPADLALAFAFAAVCLILSRTALVPLVSACMLPVLLGAESWTYPWSVLVLTGVLCAGQYLMERIGWRRPAVHVPVPAERGSRAVKWGLLLGLLAVLAAVPIGTGRLYCLVPPLVVTFVEFSDPRAGFRKAPLTVFFLLTAAAFIGVFLHWGLHIRCGLPSAVSAGAAVSLLFALSEWRGRLFAPAGAVVLVPLLLPEADLWAFPFQVAAGAAVFIGVPLAVFGPGGFRLRLGRLYRTVFREG